MAMLCARALKIIEKEYMDEELSLQSVSERLNISRGERVPWLTRSRT